MSGRSAKCEGGDALAFVAVKLVMGFSCEHVCRDFESSGIISAFFFFVLGVEYGVV